MKVNSLLKKLSLVGILAAFTLAAHTQSLDQAKKLYNEKKFEKAKPAFEKLVKQSPNNSMYNLWFGVCAFETGDFGTAEKFLINAKNRKLLDAYPYLADIYIQSYRFADAIALWNNCIAEAKKKKEPTQLYEAQLQRAEKLNRMKLATEDVQVIDSIVVDSDQLLNAYFLSEDAGAITSYVEHFQIATPVRSTVYINQKQNQAYYAAPGESGFYAIYSHFKLTDTWTDEHVVLQIDSADANYPYVMGDGVTLYFASNGNGSIGGYDLFVTRYNSTANNYLTPEQLGMPFNSPANDFLMVIDEVKGTGWFATDRNQPEGKVCLYLFIPNDTRKRLDDALDDATLTQRAQLAHIQDTWIGDIDYSELVQLARTDEPASHKKTDKDFTFVVNDNVTYFLWSDFKSNTAKSLYSKVIDTQKRVREIEDKLEDERNSYARGNEFVRNKLTPVITGNEQTLLELYNTLPQLEKQTRNTEINALSHK